MVPRMDGHPVPIPGHPASPLTYGATTPLLVGVFLLARGMGGRYAPRPARTHGLRGLTAFIFRPLWRGHTPALLPCIDSVMQPLIQFRGRIFGVVDTKKPRSGCARGFSSLKMSVLIMSWMLGALPPGIPKALGLPSWGFLVCLGYCTRFHCAMASRFLCGCRLR